MIKVSIIIPIYNLENYVAKCLESCIEQTLQDIEIICVNDGSTDQSLFVLKQFESKDSRIKIVDIPNGGVVHAREIGVAQANGAYITFVDGDDYISRDALETLYNKVVEESADIINGTMIQIVCDERKSIIRRNQQQTQDEFIRNCFRNQDFYLPARLFKRELFGQRSFTCPPEITHNEDVIMLLSLAFAAEKFISYPTETYFYIFRESSVSGSFSDKKMIHILSSRKMVLDIFEKNNLREQYRSELVFFLMIALFNVARYGNASEILSEEDIKFLSFKNLFYGDVRQMLKKHLSKPEYRWIFPLCLAPSLFMKTISLLRKKPN